MKKLFVAVVAFVSVSSMMAIGGRSTQDGAVAANDTVVPVDTTAKAFSFIAANDTVTPDTTKALMAAYLA